MNHSLMVKNTIVEKIFVYFINFIGKTVENG